RPAPGRTARRARRPACRGGRQVARQGEPRSRFRRGGEQPGERAPLPVAQAAGDRLDGQLLLDRLRQLEEVALLEQASLHAFSLLVGELREEIGAQEVAVARRQVAGRLAQSEFPSSSFSTSN